MMRIPIQSLWGTQRNWKRNEQVEGMLTTLRSGGDLPPIVLHRDADGKILINDGHHRLLAYWLFGREYLNPGEFELIDAEQVRPTMGRFLDPAKRRSIH